MGFLNWLKGRLKVRPASTKIAGRELITPAQADKINATVDAAIDAEAAQAEAKAQQLAQQEAAKLSPERRRPR